MFTVKNSTRNIVSLATFTSDDSRAALAILSVGTERLSGGTIEGKMLIDVTLSPDSEDTAAEVRTRVQDLFSNFHYEPSDAETAMLNALEVNDKQIDVIKVAPLSYLAWVTYRGAEIIEDAPEADEDLPLTVHQWELHLGVESRSASW